VVVVVVYELPAVDNVDPAGQLESLTAGLLTVDVTKLPVPKRCEQATVGSGSGLVEPPPPPQPISSRMGRIGVRRKMRMATLYTVDYLILTGQTRRVVKTVTPFEVSPESGQH
jgi:hypothetical protein